MPTGRWFPAMVALVTDVADRPAAVHRTWLTPDGRAKAPVEPQRMSLGPVAGGAVRLTPVAAELASLKALRPPYLSYRPLGARLGRH
jgi:hypothetical protein